MKKVLMYICSIITVIGLVGLFIAISEQIDGGGVSFWWFLVFLILISIGFFIPWQRKDKRTILTFKRNTFQILMFFIVFVILNAILAEHPCIPEACKQGFLIHIGPRIQIHFIGHFIEETIYFIGNSIKSMSGQNMPNSSSFLPSLLFTWIIAIITWKISGFLSRKILKE